jgi:hypothetical protein
MVPSLTYIHPADVQQLNVPYQYKPS